MTIIYLLDIAIIAALVSRWRGGWTPFQFLDAPKFVRRAVLAICIGAGAYVCGAGGWSILAAPLSWFGIIAGHGSYFPGGGPKQDNESMAFITRRVFGPTLNEAGKAFGMALTGLALTIPVSILILATTGDGLIYATAGLAKPAAYLSAYGLRHCIPVTNEFIDGDTSIAELLWGFAIIALMATI